MEYEIREVEHGRLIVGPSSVGSFPRDQLFKGGNPSRATYTEVPAQTFNRLFGRKRHGAWPHVGTTGPPMEPSVGRTAARTRDRSWTLRVKRPEANPKTTASAVCRKAAGMPGRVETPSSYCQPHSAILSPYSVHVTWNTQSTCNSTYVVPHARGHRGTPWRSTSKG
jgi:hypothetical protein